MSPCNNGCWKVLGLDENSDVWLRDQIVENEFACSSVWLSISKAGNINVTIEIQVRLLKGHLFTKYNVYNVIFIVLYVIFIVLYVFCCIICFLEGLFIRYYFIFLKRLIIFYLSYRCERESSRHKIVEVSIWETHGLTLSLRGRAGRHTLWLMKCFPIGKKNTNWDNSFIPVGGWNFL